MAPVTAAPNLAKKRKLGKGKKKSWRAADVKDIEEYLDDQRRQKEAGGLVAEKSDEKLFFVDTGKAQTVVLPVRVSKESRRNRPLRSTALVDGDDGIKSVLTPARDDYKKGRKSQKIIESVKQRAASKVKVEAVQQRTAYVQQKRSAKRAKGNLPVVTTDIWNDDELDLTKVKRPKRLMAKPSRLPATVVPHSGASVNPSYEEHQDLLRQALVVEQDKEKEALRTTRALRVSNRKDLATKDTYLEEMASGLVTDSDSEKDLEEEEKNGEVTTSVRVPLRKSKRQRKAEAKLGEQMRKKKEEADRRRREHMVFSIRTMKSEIRKQDVKEKDKSEAKRKLKEEEPFKTKRLGKLRFQEPDVELKLSTELVGSLRQVKPEGNLLIDAYKSMQRRNILEPRSKQKFKRKYKLKSYTKRSHKELPM